MKFVRILVLLCFAAGVSAQNPSDIQHNPDYYYAEGEGLTLEEAEQSAMERLVSSISISVSVHHSWESLEMSGSGGDTYSENVSSAVRSSSFITLRNVSTRILKEEPNAKVARWISKAEVEEIYKERSLKIADYVETGKRAEQQLQLDDALRNYYWALVLSQTNPDPVYVSFHEKEENCAVFLPQKIKAVIAAIQCNLVDCRVDGNRYVGTMRFAYNGRDVASLQIRYNDGQSYVGPVMAKDGTCEVELVTLPTDKKIQLRFEYKFMNEAMNLDSDLAQAFKGSRTPIIDNAVVEVPVKVDTKHQTLKPALKVTESVSAVQEADREIQPEPASKKKTITLETVDDPTPYQQQLDRVEQAIAQHNPKLAYEAFTPECYKLFQTLLEKTGTVSLVGSKQTYTFVKAGNQVLGRPCKVKIKHTNGKTFMENISFRFDADTRTIQTFAFCLTKKAEDDIFNAATSWPEVSRYTILQFMEDYQTAYALKREDYISTLFSEGALIISGTMLKPASEYQSQDGATLVLSNDQVKYTVMNKQQYLSMLSKQFKQKDYVHLSFEDNITKIINVKRLPYGTAFAIQIKQYYHSPNYSDKGYLSLVLDTSEKQPIIHVRLWQPEKKDMLSVEEFINKFKF
ncbi:MAG: hypothetical protein ACI36X_04080 [Bacteroidaceae bacterium]